MFCAICTESIALKIIGSSGSVVFVEGTRTGMTGGAFVIMATTEWVGVGDTDTVGVFVGSGVAVAVGSGVVTSWVRVILSE